MFIIFVYSKEAFCETLDSFKKDKKKVAEEEKEALEILAEPRDDVDDNAQG